MTTSTNDGEAWIEKIRKLVLNDLKEVGHDDSDDRWSPFMSLLGLELRAFLEEILGKGTPEKNIDGPIRSILKGAIDLGFTSAEEFRTSPDSIGEFCAIFESKISRADICVLWRVRKILVEDDLVVPLREALKDQRRESLELEKKNLPDDVKKQRTLGPYMKFVNREGSINKLLKHAGEQYHLYLKWDQSEEHQQWAACSGGPGLGKTTFCRKAFTRAAECACVENSTLWTDVPNAIEFYEIVRACVDSGRHFRISFSTLLSPGELSDPCMSLAHRLTEAVDKTVKFPKRHDGARQLDSVLRALTKEQQESLVVINFDETNFLVKGDQSMHDYLVKIVGFIREFNKIKVGFVFCIFSGTWALKLHQLLKTSSGGYPPMEIPLPLLSTDHVVEIVTDFLVRSRRQYSRGTANDGEQGNLISPQNMVFLGFVLKVLGGIPRYIEMLVYALGQPMNGNVFSWDTFEQSLMNDEDECKTNVRSTSHILLDRVRNFIKERYDPEFEMILPKIPHKTLVCYSLFEWCVEPKLEIGGKTISALEKLGIVFLMKKEGRLVLIFPLVLLLKTVNGRSDPPMLLQEIRVILSSDENERNSLSIFAMKAEALQGIHGYVSLRDLLPLAGTTARKNEDIRLNFDTFDLIKSKERITLTNWKECLSQLQGKGAIVLNAKGSPFSDMLMVSKGGDFVVYIQEKQRQGSRDQNVKGNTVPKVTLEAVQEEHEKCNVDQNHLFVMITDDGPDEEVKKKLGENELVLTNDTHEFAIGSLLALLRLYNHFQGKRNEISFRKRKANKSLSTSVSGVEGEEDDDMGGVAR